ncbi:hypothetical protein ACJJTC_009666 [Scirpophaga incertulas]
MYLLNIVKRITVARNARRDLHEPNEISMKDRVLDTMEHFLYVTQYRLMDLKELVAPKVHDIRFRVAFIYCRLDTLIEEMHTMITMLNKTLKQKSVHHHLIYYTYFLKKNIDVTYIVEHMIKVHTDFMIAENEKIKQMQNSKEPPNIGSDRNSSTTISPKPDESTKPSSETG